MLSIVKSVKHSIKSYSLPLQDLTAVMQSQENQFTAGNKMNQSAEKYQKRIEELEAENERLKAEIEKLKTQNKEFYTLKNQLKSSVDLGEIEEKLPPYIPEHKKWKANDYPKEWSPERKATDYLLTFWKNYPVTQSYFSNIKGGQSFYKYLKRNDLFSLLPDSFQLQLKKRIKQK